RRNPRGNFPMARSQRIFLHSFGIQLLHARYQAAGQRGDRRYGPAERLHWPHLAGDADLYPDHGRNARGDEPVPRGAAEGDEGKRGGRAAAKGRATAPAHRWVCSAGVSVSEIVITSEARNLLLLAPER